MIRARHLVLSAFASMLFVATAGAETVYHWVDESGQSHFSDVVPAAYKKVAKPIEYSGLEPGAADKEAAEARAAALKAAANAIVVPSVPAKAGTSGGAKSAGAGAASAPAYDASHCKAWRKRFAQSKACFDGLALGDSTLMPGAFRVCGDDVPNPYPTCGAPDSYDDDDSPGGFPYVITTPGRRHHRGSRP